MKTSWKFVPAALLLAGGAALAQTTPVAPPITKTMGPLNADQQRFHDIYKQLVEINTTHSVGSTTESANAMRQRLLDAGFAAGDMQVIEPFPKKGNLILRWKGSGKRQPLLLLAHMDVVEARREDWKTDPFKLQETDGYFTARGSVDDKAMASSFVSVLDQLRREGFKPDRDIILALTADEERGDVSSNGVAWIAEHQPELLKAELGINEGGGGQLRDGKPVLHRLQVAEKMYTSYELEVRDVGGHSSVPTANNPVYKLANSLTKLGAYRFPVKIAEVTQTFFARSAPLSPGQLGEDMKAIGAGRLDDAVVERLSATPGYNALLRTTCVATMVNAGHAENALPQSAKATVNCRILPHDNPDDIDRQLRQVLGPDVTVKQISKPTISPASPYNGELARIVESLTQQMWPGTPVIPAMSTGATDSRFLRNKGIQVYGVSGLFSDPSDMRQHGLDERVEIARLYDAREFLYQLVKRLSM